MNSTFWSTWPELDQRRVEADLTLQKLYFMIQ